MVKDRFNSLHSEQISFFYLSIYLFILFSLAWLNSFFEFELFSLLFIRSNFFNKLSLRLRNLSYDPLNLISKTYTLIFSL
jgi:hypothetical protein